MVHLNIFFFLSLCLFKTECVDYCKIDTCSTKSEHVGCKNKKLKMASGCKLLDMKLYKKRILGMHNKNRNAVACGLAGQPSAANMKRLFWDSELEKLAELNMMNCKMEHDACRDVPRFKVGQNVLLGDTDNVEHTLTWMENGWFGEKKDLTDAKIISNYVHNNKYSCYAQMIWANSQYIGCAMASSSSHTFAVCNYGPGGNITGAEMYKIGEPQSACPEGFEKDDFFQGLCDGVSPTASTFWLLWILNILSICNDKW